MPDLDFAIKGVEPVMRGLTPLLHFKLEVTNAARTAPVQAVILHSQIQIQPAQRTYNGAEKERLVDLFGTPERWGQTLRNRLWAHAQASVGAFSDSIETDLPVACTYDLNIAASKYFYALEDGLVPLLFLFSGTVFYTGADGRLQVAPIPWDKECTFAMSAGLWRDLMEAHYPNSAYLCLERDTFERLYAYKRRHGIATWDQVLERLLPALEGAAV
jgi:hypothetical protein